MVKPNSLPKKILLAEDDPDDRKFFFQFLQHRTDLSLFPAVENGVEVFEFLDKMQDPFLLPDLIILDQNMPKCNGLQTLAVLKNKAQYENIPIFIYSTYTDDYLVQRSLALGAVSVLEKPYSLEGYEKMIDDMLRMIQKRIA